MEKILVAVRFRPSITEETLGDRQWKIKDNKISLDSPISGFSFAFDHVFEQSSTNASVYDTLIKSIIQAAINGFNGTAFAYGQTSSGKTFTMNGTPIDQGIIPRAVRDIFDMTNMIIDREFLIRVSYMEIYNEEINDLLSLANQKLPIHESLERGVYVAGLREEIVNNADQVLELIKHGEVNRHVGETNMNIRSSRSHTIFRMVIESSVKDSTSRDDYNADAIRVSVLNLVDLAGSERIAKTGADGVRLKEGKHINKSLMILGNVINKLSENGKQRAHIPYRDSKLTRILQPALGGNAKTSIICTVAPEEVHIEETRGTLQFATRAKRITNCAQVNEILTDAALLKRQKQEIEELRNKLQGHHSEVLEQVILKQRNDMHKSALEREKLAMELEEERKTRQALELCIGEQHKNIDSLNELLSSYQTKLSVHGTNHSGTSYEDMHSRNCESQDNSFATPNSKAMSNHFVVKRLNHSKVLVASPFPENLTNIANDDMWQLLNNGFTTDLDTLQISPYIKCGAANSNATFTGRRGNETHSSTSTSLSDLHLENLKEQYAVLEQKYSQLKDENDSLAKAVSFSNQDASLLRAQRDELSRDLNCEREHMKDLKENLRLFQLAYMERECLLDSLCSRSKAIIENLSSFQIP